MKKNKGMNLYRKAVKKLKNKQKQQLEILVNREIQIKFKEDELKQLIASYKNELAHLNKYHPMLNISEDRTNNIILDSPLQFIMDYRIASPQFFMREKQGTKEREGFVKIHIKDKQGQHEFFWALSPSVMRDIFTENTYGLRQIITKDITSKLLAEIHKFLHKNNDNY